MPNDLIFRAAEFEASFSISFADCFALASAVEHGAVLVTGDPEFRAVEHLVKIAWVQASGRSRERRCCLRCAMAGDEFQCGAKQKAGAGLSDRFRAGVQLRQGALRQGDVDPLCPS